MLSMVNVHLGYNQILMAEEDEEMTTFIRDQGTYYYWLMPFGLQNVGATFQCLMDKVFKDQIRINVLAYVDDILVKSLDSSTHHEDLKETFDALAKYEI